MAQEISESWVSWLWWPRGWTSNARTVLTMTGSSTLRFIEMGPPESRVGMLFNDSVRMMAWSGAASHCDLMASMAKAEESGFNRSLLLAQLNQWQGRSATVYQQRARKA